MGLVVVLFTVGFNALFWIVYCALSPTVAHHVGVIAAWAVALVAPGALLALVARLRLVKLQSLVLVSAVSLMAAGALSQL